MLKLLDLLARGNLARATEDLHDRNALLILDQQNDSNTDTGNIWVCSDTSVCSDGGPAGGG